MRNQVLETDDTYQLTEFPFVSIVTIALNSSKYLSAYFESINNQNYPPKKLEIIIVDGGSSDSTIDDARKFGAKVISRPDLKDQGETRKAIGIRESKGDYILFMDSDNMMPHSNWLRKMLIPLLCGDAIASQPLRYHYSKAHILLNRYFALLGSSDPVAYYMRKSDHLSYFDSVGYIPAPNQKKDFYYIFKFNEKNLPTIGANGHLIKKEILLKSQCDEENYFHIDVNVDLIRQGYDRYAFIEDDIIHLSFSDNSIANYLKKRTSYMHIYGTKNRRYLIFDPKKISDVKLLMKFIVYASTFLKPLSDSIRGYVRIRDSVWFIHPIVCFGFLVMYSIAIIRKYFSKRH